MAWAMHSKSAADRWTTLAPSTPADVDCTQVFGTGGFTGGNGRSGLLDGCMTEGDGWLAQADNAASSSTAMRRLPMILPLTSSVSGCVSVGRVSATAFRRRSVKL